MRRIFVRPFNLVSYVTSSPDIPACEGSRCQGSSNPPRAAGTPNTYWAQETFAYANARDGSTWVGIQTGQHVIPAPSGLLVHPDRLPEPAEPESTVEGPEGGSEAPPPGDQGNAPEPAPTQGSTQFYAQFDLDPVRCIKELGEIAPNT